MPKKQWERWNISCIRSWMAKIFLCLDDDKTEMVVIGSRSSLSQLSIPFDSGSIGDEVITPASHARNIGFIFDQHMNLQSESSSTCKLAWFQCEKYCKVQMIFRQRFNRMPYKCFHNIKIGK